MILSPNFTRAEFEFSQTALMNGIDNTIPDDLVVRARYLAREVLQPLRDFVASPVVISSGYRCQELDRIIKHQSDDWVSQSQHTKAEAADIQPPFGWTNVELAQVIINLGLPFDQMIVELPNTGWLHVSHRSGRSRREVRTWLGEPGVYPLGIVL